MPIFVVVEALIGVVDLMLDWLSLYLFGPILETLQIVACFPLSPIKVSMM